MKAKWQARMSSPPTGHSLSGTLPTAGPFSPSPNCKELVIGGDRFKLQAPGHKRCYMCYTCATLHLVELWTAWPCQHMRCSTMLRMVRWLLFCPCHEAWIRSPQKRRTSTEQGRNCFGAAKVLSAPLWQSPIQWAAQSWQSFRANLWTKDVLAKISAAQLRWKVAAFGLRHIAETARASCSCQICLIEMGRAQHQQPMAS